MKQIKIERCSGCPFADESVIGVFSYTYCTLGLYLCKNGRQFTADEMYAGLSDVEIARLARLNRSPRYPHVIPEWCGLRAGVEMRLLLKGEKEDE